MTIGTLVGGDAGDICAHCNHPIRHTVVAVECACPSLVPAALRTPPRNHVHGTNQARVYAEKFCRRCGATFVPSGPRALDCATCRGVAE